MPHYRRWLSAAFFAVVAASPAAAHTGHGLAGSAWGGFAHPFLGTDHVAAMVSVGLWAALAGGRRVYIWPMAFALAMLAGGAAGHAGVSLPMVEPAIAASVATLGLLVASGAVLPAWIGAGLIAAFGVFHGHAHGAEAGDAAFSAYAIGFALATATLHAGGILLGRQIAPYGQLWTPRAVGLATSALGVALLLK